MLTDSKQWRTIILSVLGISLTALLVLVPRAAHAQGSPSIELVLRLRARVSMQALAEAVTDPGSPRYGRFYTPEEIRRLSAPSDAEYSALISRLVSKGFRVTGESKSHLFVTIAGAQPLVESTFATRIENLPSDSHSSGRYQARRRMLRPASIPPDLALVQSVIGLDNTRASRTHLLLGSRGPQAASSQVASPRAGTIPGLPPSYIQSAYGFTGIYQEGYTGKGQDLAIATYDGYHPEDIAAYYAQWGINPAPAVDQVVFNGATAENDGSAMETQTDAELSGMIAPGAAIHVFASSHNDDAGEVQLFTAILDDNRAKVVNYSWGDCETNVSAQHFQDMNAVFARAVAQGVNILVASGDWGAAGCPVILPPTPSSARGTTLSADFPAANPYVVAVGGTTVVGGEDGNVQENAWEQSGGGVSSVFPQPAWQSGFQAPFVRRAFPDVAFNADPNSGEPSLAHSGGSATWIQIGGTSIAAPQWSGFMALVDEARGSQGALGFLNPQIYALSQQDYAADFHDVLQGSNGYYTAGSGWDAVTGWGSLRASELFDYLRQR